MLISAGFRLSLLVAAWLFFRVSGALFNPNVSTALALVGAITPLRALFYIIVQLLGAICAAAVIQALMPGSLASKCASGNLSPANAYPLSTSVSPGPGVNKA